MPPKDQLDIYLLTFNCARLPVNPTELATSLLSALPDSTTLPDLFALSLQEIAPIAHSFLGGVLVDPYFAAVARTVSLAATQRLRDRAGDADEGDPGLIHVLTRHVGLTALMVFARPEVQERIRWVKTAGTGCGFWDMGNKGAVGSRLAISTGSAEEDMLEVTFVAAHLAPHEKNNERRNQDFRSIVRNLGFTEDNAMMKRVKRKASSTEETEPLLNTASGSTVTGLYETSGLVFFAGDLNYRTAASSPTELDQRTYPQPHHPENSSFHHINYLSRDQLNQEKAAHRTLHHFSEPKITFAPTYKYAHNPEQKGSIETAQPGDPSGTWNWAPHRWPSWCDRILYFPSSPSTTIYNYTSLPLLVTSDHRPVALSLSIQPQKINTDYSSPYPLNPSFAEERASARRLEVIVGVLAYLSLTREGNTIMAGMLAGAVASWYVVHSML